MEQKYHYQEHTGAINVLAAAAERNSDSARNIRTIARACTEGKSALDPRFAESIRKGFAHLVEDRLHPERVELVWEEVQKLRQANYYHWHSNELQPVLSFNSNQWEALQRTYDAWKQKQAVTTE